MRRLFFIVLFFAFCIQEVRSQNRIGLVGGGLYAKSNLTNQNQSGVLSQSSTTFGNIYSWYGGIVYDIKVTNEFSVKTKLLFTNKGWTEEKNLRIYSVDSISGLTIPVESIKSKETYKFNYLELPVNFTFYTPLGKSLLSFGAGPYISFGLSGKYNFQALYSSKHFTKSYISGTDIIQLKFIVPVFNNNGTYSYHDSVVNIQKSTITSSLVDSNNYLANSSSSIGFKASQSNKTIYNAYQFDYGASLEASLEFRNGLCISAAYNTGVTNVIKEHYGALQNRHRVIIVGLGYYMKKKRKHTQ